MYSYEYLRINILVLFYIRVILLSGHDIFHTLQVNTYRLRAFSSAILLPSIMESPKNCIVMDILTRDGIN